MIKQNLHTHTLYCDGKDTCEDLIKAAITGGFSSIGFSGHGYTPTDTSYCMSPENTKKYLEEINALKEKYDGKINVYKGIEADLQSEINKADFDYIIGSVHYIPYQDEYLPVDLSAEETKKIINRCFGGKAMAYARAYYDEVKKLPSVTDCDILGHFDLVTKFSRYIPELDTSSKEYITYALDAVQAVSKKIRVFEVNTGAMSRGYTTAPYPALNILKEMRFCGMKPIISSDCHSCEHLDYGFDTAKELLKEAGYKEMLYFVDNEFKEYPL